MNLGDWHDSDYASRWDNENHWTALSEFEALRDDALDLRKAAPRARFVWVHGNHDDNPLQPGRVPEKVRGAVEECKRRILEPAIQGWIQVPYAHTSYYRLGQVTFQHGAQTNVYAERDQAIAYGVPFGLHVSAHTHRPKRITPVEAFGGPIFGLQYCNVGCGADWDQMRYIARSKHHLWGRAMLFGECDASLDPNLLYATKMWDAELKIHSMASPYAAM